MFNEFVARATRQLQQAGADHGSCRERLARMADAYARFILESRSEMQMLHRDLMQCGKQELQGLLPDATRQIPSLFATILEEGIAAHEIRPVDTYRVSNLLLGMINSLTARRMFAQVARSLSEDINFGHQYTN